MGRTRYPTHAACPSPPTAAAAWFDGLTMKGTRVRLWKIELQKLANQSGLAIFVAHHPPGTSKWNCIAHRMFAVISQNWRGKPLLSRQLIVQLIAATRTATGLTISCAIDAGRCPKGAKIPDAQRAAINAKYDAFHPDWNYTTTSSKSAFDFKILKYLFRHAPLCSIIKVTEEIRGSRRHKSGTHPGRPMPRRPSRAGSFLEWRAAVGRARRSPAAR